MEGAGHATRLRFKTSCVGARLNFKTSCVGVYKCLSLIVGLAITAAIWPKEVVSSGDFILLAVATSWAMSLFGIYPGRASVESCNIWVLETTLLLSSWEIIGAL